MIMLVSRCRVLTLVLLCRYPDFTRYHGLDGIYLANKYDTTNPMGPSYSDDVVTQITFNKGTKPSTPTL